MRDVRGRAKKEKTMKKKVRVDFSAQTSILVEVDCHEYCDNEEYIFDKAYVSICGELTNGFFEDFRKAMEQ